MSRRYAPFGLFCLGVTILVASSSGTDAQRPMARSHAAAKAAAEGSVVPPDGGPVAPPFTGSSYFESWTTRRSPSSITPQVWRTNDSNPSNLAACAAPAFTPQMPLALPSAAEVVAADLNADGASDLVASSFLGTGGPGTTVSVFLGDGNGGFVLPAAYGTVAQPGPKEVADLDEDTHLDVAVVGAAGVISILLGDGSGGLAQASTVGVASAADLAAADLDEDGHVDLVAPGFFDSSVSVQLGRGDGSFEPPVAYAVGVQPAFVAIGDVDNDGVADLAVVNNFDTTVSILRGVGDGTFHPQHLVSVPGGNDLRSLALADLDDDGDLDMAVVNAFISAVAVFLGGGDGSFSLATLHSVGGQPTRIVATDFNDDQFLDLGVANADAGTVSILLGNGNGAFGPEYAVPAAYGASSIAVADMNLDGSPDLAVGNTFAGSISILLNACPFTERCADRDGDGYGHPGSEICPDGPIDDCDDEDPDSFPGTPERCDGADNDCDGVVPEGESDPDQDGVSGCAGDCDNLSALTFPGASEMFDAVDNDCDGIIDDGLDDDEDGIPDFNDACPGTSSRSGVDPTGCPVCSSGQEDDDDEGDGDPGDDDEDEDDDDD